MIAILLFILAGIGEIGGGYLIWLWLREGKPFIGALWAVLHLLCTALLQHSSPSLPLAEFMQPMVGYSSCCLFYGGGALMAKSPII